MMQRAGLPSAQQVDEVIDEVLSAPEFQYRGESMIVRWATSVLEWIENMIRRWLPQLDPGQARVISWIVVGATLVVGVLLFARWAAGRASRPGADATSGPATTEKPRDAAAWVAWAREAARDGRLRAAATGLYQSTILHLDSTGTVRYREWKTPGDYALEVSAAEMRTPFLDFLGRFLEVAFGPHDPTVEAFESLAEDAARLGCPV